jgi:hypothetical protein
MEQHAVSHRRNKKQQSYNLLSHMACHTIFRMIPFFDVVEDLLMTTNNHKNDKLHETVDEGADGKRQCRLYLLRLKMILNTVYRYVIYPLRKVFLEVRFTGVSLLLTTCGVCACFLLWIAATVDPVLVLDDVDKHDAIHYYLVTLPLATLDVLQTVAGCAIRF